MGNYFILLDYSMFILFSTIFKFLYLEIKVLNLSLLIYDTSNLLKSLYTIKTFFRINYSQ